MYPDELDDYLEERFDIVLDRDGYSDPAAQDGEEMEFEDWCEHWVVVEGELVAR
ncbi:MAG: hypothetical protein KGD60_15100 [Candidatus Thorarchaeota archaeon]|nr:hypothetical protein [Candidatus Thorarchaeota archaeon]